MPKHTFDDMVRIKKEHAKNAPVSLKYSREPAPEKEVMPRSRRNIEDNPILNRPRIKRENVETNIRPESTFIKKNMDEKGRRRVETSYNGGFDDREDFNSGESKHGMWFAAIIAIIFLLFGVTFLFGQAKITIDPKIENLNLNEDMVATRGVGDGDLAFDLVLIPGEETDTLIGKTEENVSLKARGTVILYNSFSTAPQILDIDTRLEGSNGKMYKTEKRVTIPGMTKDGTPGSVEVGVYGVEAGEAYNSVPLDFKIFGFKNGPKYTKFYARSKNPIEGGYIGKMTTVSEEEKTAALARLKDSLRAKLIQKTADQIPEGFILFDDAVKLVIEQETVDKIGEAGKVPVTVKGTLYGFLFEESELTKKIVKTSLEDYDDSDVYIPNLADFTFTLSAGDISFKDIRNISFNLTGSGKIVYKVDDDQIRGDTLGAKKKDFQNILSRYTNIDTASVVIRPFWKGTFPEKMNKIKVNVEYPN